MTTRAYELSTLMLACIDGAVGVRADVRSKLRVYAEQFYDFMRGCNMTTRLRLLEAAERHLLSSMGLALSAESNMLDFVGDCSESTHIKHSEDCVRREVTQTILAAFCAQMGMNALRALVDEYGCTHCATSEMCVALVHIYDLSYTELRSVRDLLGPEHAVYDKLLPVMGMNALRALVDEYGCTHCATSEVCVALVHIYDLSYTELRSVRDLLGSRHAVYGKLLPVIAMNPKLTC
eukprot:gene32648-41519_t